MKTVIRFTLVCALVLTVAGCNFFNWMHPPGRSHNSDVLMADGQAALNSGDYQQAEAIFEKILVGDPDNAQAMLGHATAVMRDAGVDLITLATLLNGGEDFNVADYENYGLEDLKELEDLMDTLIQDLEPIANGSTDGSVAADNLDVNLVLTVAYLASAAIDIFDAVGTDLFYTDDGDPDPTDWTGLAGLSSEEKTAIAGLIDNAQETAAVVMDSLDFATGEDGGDEDWGQNFLDMLEDLEQALLL